MQLVVISGALKGGGSFQEWQQVFYVTASITIAGSLLFIVFGSAELQPWSAIAIESRRHSMLSVSVICADSTGEKAKVTLEEEEMIKRIQQSVRRESVFTAGLLE